IELMVVLLILAILLAIAIPTFLGVTGSANDRAAQSNLNTALTDAKGVYESNQQSYPSTSALISKVQANEPSLNLVSDPGSTASVTAGDLSMTVSAGGNGAIIFTLAKKTNECWWVADNTQTIANGGSATAPTLPWKNITLTNGKGSGSGVPNASGEYYGVYKITPGTSYCDIAGLGTNSSTIQSSGFPSAA
ncbi:MAG: hypothetical protein M0Z62_07625, partial [Actinomycetota bacterium]|nr:hypothetical protein [Actinomycetota bacterium]